MKGWTMGSHTESESRNSNSIGLPFANRRAPPSRVQPASFRSATARASSARSWPDPSGTGGVQASPNTSAGTCPLNGSSRASSSADGLPVAIRSVFWKNETVRS
ncbi:hypothetical protein CHKEEEPN_4937 [Methylorubrum podarium]|nr:hypothetical protein CHKEEEPN_4937 [Methylorubrum podarium]